MAEKNVFEVPDLRDMKPPPQAGRLLFMALIVLMVTISVLSGCPSVDRESGVKVSRLLPWYQIEPEEVGVVLRFGHYTGPDTGPGLHFKLPFGIDKVYHMPVQRQLTDEYGFRSPDLPVLVEVARTDPKMESSMLTGDLNTVVVQWVVQYRIVDPLNYLFRVRNVELTFRDMTEAVMREVVGDRTVDEVITVGRQEITIVGKEKLQSLCDLYETGIQVDQVVLQDVTPPEQVKPAFNAVNQAEQEKEKLINEAQSEYNKIVPRARGEAQQTVLAAEGYALDRVNRARGEVARFEAVYEQYRQAPEVTRQRIYLETLGAILPSVGRKIIIDDEVRGILPLLNLDSAAAPRRQAPQGDQ